MRKPRRQQITISVTQSDLKWLNAEALRRNASRSEIAEECFAQVRGIAEGNDLIEMLLSRLSGVETGMAAVNSKLEKVDQHARMVRSILGHQVRIGYQGDGVRPKTLEDFTQKTRITAEALRHEQVGTTPCD